MLIHLEKIIFYLLIFCLPFQTRTIIYQWGNSFNEWTSAYLYLTDLLFILLVILWAWRRRRERFLKGGLTFQLSRLAQKIEKAGFWLVIFLVIGFISLARAENIQLAFYAWFKILEMAGLFFYLRYNFSRLFDFKRLAQVFLVSGFLQAVIGLAQYLNQKSLGLWFFRESPLSPEIAGVAEIVVGKITLIRAYGSLPHPNLLAVFLFLAIFFFYFLWLKKKKLFIKDCLGLTVFGFLLIAFWLTFSRLTIIIFILTSLLFFSWTYLKKPSLRRRVLGLLTIFIVFCSLFTILLWPEISTRFSISLNEQAIGLRAFYNQTALSIIGDQPWLGIGLGNFVWQIRETLHLLAGWLHQPAHNLYLLIASELGLIGLVVFLIFIFRLLKEVKSREYFGWFIVLSFLLIGLFDHFFWTLQQGQLIFWLVLGLVAGENEIRLTKSGSVNRSPV